MSVRFFGYCDHRGCKARKPILAFTHNAKPMARTADQQMFCLYNAAYFRSADTDAIMRRRGLWCEDHDTPMRVEPLKATYNPEKVCDGRCTHAKRAACDCSCRGANHGSAY